MSEINFDNQGVLYLISTPIGNLDDITIRSKRILSELDIILAEDTRKTGKMLLSYGVQGKKMISYFEENEINRIPEVIELLSRGKKVGLVSNAGTPLISDPGFKLVKRAIKRGIRIIPVPGASALISALISSGFHPDHFIFLGFLPKKIGKKKKLFNEANKLSPKLIPTICFYEAPTRLIKTLKLVRGMFGDIEISVGREITKVHEEFLRGPISFVLPKLEKKGKLKGEITVVLNCKNDDKKNQDENG